MFRAAMQGVCASSASPDAPSRPHDDGFGDIDPMTAGRAAGAAAAVSARYAGLIEEVSKNPSMTPEQRAAAISGLRARQSAESAAASRAIMEDAGNAARARRGMRNSKPRG
jgi:hypothetical protein